MPSISSIRYRQNKIRYGFTPQIRYDIEEHVKEVYEEEYESEPEDMVIIDEEEKTEEDMLSLLVDEVSKIRKNAKRKLEMWIRAKKVEVNSLDERDKSRLLDFIEERFYKKKH